MKKWFAVLLIALLVFSLVAGMILPFAVPAEAASAVVTSPEGLCYTVDSKTGNAEIVGYVGTDTAVTVPAALDNAPVTAIGNSAFEDNTALTAITLPYSVTRIGECAFYGCSSLQSVTLGRVSTIEYSAFHGCSSLVTVQYSGSQAQWYAMDIAPFNDPLTSAAITYETATETLSLLPQTKADFRTLSEGGGTINITAQTKGYRFTGNGGWPSAYTSRTADEYVAVDVFSDTYLNFDFTVSGGYTNIIIAFEGMDIVTLRTVGHYVSLNRLIHPSNVDEEGIIYDIGAGTYTASVHVGALGCDPALMTNGTFSLSDIKIYSVSGATVTVRDLSVGEPQYDILKLAQTSYTVKTAQSLLPAAASDFGKAHTDTGSLTVTALSEGYRFVSSNGWPAAQTTNYLSGGNILFAALDDYIYYDFTVYGTAQTHLALYFAGTDPATTVKGTYASLNPLIHPALIAANGDIIDFDGGTHRGFIRVRDLGCDDALLVDGKVPISDIKIFSVNKQRDPYAKVEVNALAVADIVTYDATTTTTASAATTTTTTTTAPQTDVTFSVSSHTAMMGEFVEVAVSVSDNHGLVNGQLFIDYDPAVLEIASVWDDADRPYFEEVNPAVFGSGYFWDFAVPTPGRAKFAFATGSLNGSLTGGTLFTLTFNVIGDLGDGTTISLSSPEMGAAKNSTDYDPTVAFQNGTVTYTVRRGDVTGDGKVTLLDAVRAFYYVEGDLNLVGLAFAAADLNGNRDITIDEVVKILHCSVGLIDRL